jgi:NAD dependent epimerase/dehydratase family enzyme
LDFLLGVVWICPFIVVESVVLEGQRVISAKLLRQGFMIHYPEITGALKEVIGG